MLREPTGSGSFLEMYGSLRVRPEGEMVARCRFMPDERHSNLLGYAHGGFVLAVVDQAIFLGPTALGRPALGGLTVDVSAHFVRPTRIGVVLDAVVEIVRETKRQIFTRGTVEQEGEVALYFSGLLLKPR